MVKRNFRGEKNLFFVIHTFRDYGLIQIRFMIGGSLISMKLSTRPLFFFDLDITIVKSYVWRSTSFH